MKSGKFGSPLSVCCKSEDCKMDMQTRLKDGGITKEQKILMVQPCPVLA